MIIEGTSYPRSRESTSDPPQADEVADLVGVHWGLEVADVRQAQSSRVYFVDSADGTVVFRANPGWDGPTPPATIVEFVAHLSELGAAVPGIIPATTGLWVEEADQVLSLESKLPGEEMAKSPLESLHQAGETLAQIGIAAESFHAMGGKMLPTAGFFFPRFQRSIARLQPGAEMNAVVELQRSIEREFAEVLNTEIPWILCRGDVTSRNTLKTDGGDISCVDFDSAEYAPAILDPITTKFQWRMGTGEGMLDPKSASMFLRGYYEVRGLSQEEIAAMPLVWCAYFVDRLTFLHRKWSINTGNRKIWPVAEMIRELPSNAIPMACEVLRLAGRV